MHERDLYLLFVRTLFGERFVSLHDTVDQAEQAVRQLTGTPDMSIGEILGETDLGIDLFVFKDEGAQRSFIETRFA